MASWVDAYVEAARRVAEDAQTLVPLLAPRRGDVVVNVHEYAWESFEAFLRRYYSDGRRRILALSMNPGRNGAVQTGIAFTDAPTAREILPGFDSLARRPKVVRTERPEVSGQKLKAWAQVRFGGLPALYRRVLFAICCPVAVLHGPRLANVPIASLAGRPRLVVDEFYERSARALAHAARPSGVWILGDYAARRWSACVEAEPSLASIPTAVTHHPAAHITNRRKFSGWTRSLAALSSAPDSPISGVRARR